MDILNMLDLVGDALFGVFYVLLNLPLRLQPKLLMILINIDQKLFDRRINMDILIELEIEVINWVIRTL